MKLSLQADVSASQCEGGSHRWTSIGLRSLVCGAFLALPVFANGDDPLPAPDAAITKEALEHHVRTLASDAMNGRGAATDGSARAARYLVAALERAGLKPGARDGTYLQPLSAVVVEHTAPPQLVFTTKTGEREIGQWGRDFGAQFTGAIRSTETLPIVRVTLEADMPDHAQPDKALFFRATPADRKEWLRLRGQGDAETWGLDLRVGSAKAGKSRPAPSRRVIFGTPPDSVCPRVKVRGTMRESLLWKGYTDVQLIVSEDRRGVLENNVVAVIPGSDPTLSQDVVVLHARYDHVGPPEAGVVGPNGDRVRNGANNAAGCAALLELAERYAASPPARTTVFLFTSAMSGMSYGAAQFLEHPSVDADRILAVLSVDRIGIPDSETEGRSYDLWLSGYGKSNFGAAIGAANVSAGKAPFPNARSDHYGISTIAKKNTVLWYSLFCTPSNVRIPLWGDDADRLDYGHLLRVTRVVQGAADLLVSGECTPTRLADTNR